MIGGKITEKAFATQEEVALLKIKSLEFFIDYGGRCEKKCAQNNTKTKVSRCW